MLVDSPLVNKPLLDPLVVVPPLDPPNHDLLLVVVVEVEVKGLEPNDFELCRPPLGLLLKREKKL